MTIDIEKAVAEARGSVRADLVTSHVCVWIDPDSRTAVEMAAWCHVADRGGSAEALERIYVGRNTPVHFWLPSEVARKLIPMLPDGSPDTIRLILCDGSGRQYHEAPVQP
jgi:hypothetical protein